MSGFRKSKHALHRANFWTDCQCSQTEMNLCKGHPQSMLIEIYIETLLVNEESAD
jgi:hypothetical protein